MNIVNWMWIDKMIDLNISSIYLGVHDGRSQVKTDQQVEAYNLPEPHIHFGQFSLTELVKNDEIHFFSTTSEHAWSLDFFGLQYGSDRFWDLERTGDDVKWTMDWPQDYQKDLKESDLYKAYLDPNSPFIALPQSLFALVKEQWVNSLGALGEDTSCSNDKCLVFKPCSEV